jgi:hypothetical protein
MKMARPTSATSSDTRAYVDGHASALAINDFRLSGRQAGRTGMPKAVLRFLVAQAQCNARARPSKLPNTPSPAVAA